jgi:hypothetical protein
MYLYPHCNIVQVQATYTVRTCIYSIDCIYRNYIQAVPVYSTDRIYRYGLYIQLLPAYTVLTVYIGSIYSQYILYMLIVYAVYTVCNEYRFWLYTACTVYPGSTYCMYILPILNEAKRRAQGTVPFQYFCHDEGLKYISEVSCVLRVIVLLFSLVRYGPEKMLKKRNHAIRNPERVCS